MNDDRLQKNFKIRSGNFINFLRPSSVRPGNHQLIYIEYLWARCRGLSVCWNPDCRLRPLLKMSPIDGDETSRGRNPENRRRRDFGRRRRHRQSGFQHTDRPRPSSPEMFNIDHNAGRESLSHQIISC